jgi:anti-sigma regulatory factor (Ser/Thr protein kinase)
VITSGTLERGTRTDWPLSSALPPFGALTTAPGSARAYVKDVLNRWGMSDLSYTAELVVSELVTNAVKGSTDSSGEPVYADGRMAVIRLCVMSDGTRVLIEVHDQSDMPPVPRDAGDSAESGRGLLLVETLAARWGWHFKPAQLGKVVWAVLERAEAC